MAQNLGEHQARALLSEALRAELQRLITLQAEAVLRSDAETDARIAALEEENTALRRMARRGDFAAVEPWIAQAADRAGAAAPDEIDPALGRTAIRLKRGLNDAEIAVLDGEPVEDAAGPLVRPYTSAGVGEFTAIPMTLSAAIEETRRRYPSREMRGNTKTCADLLLSRFGDVPVAGIDEAMLLDLFA